MEESGGTWKIVLENGPSTPASPGPPSFKGTPVNREYMLGSTFDAAAEDWIKRVASQMKPGGGGGIDYNIVEQTIGPDLLTDLIAAAPRVGGATVAPTPRRPAPNAALYTKIAALLAPAKPNKKPVLLDGPPGAGKTFIFREFGKKGGFHHMMEVAGCASMESIDFLGGLIPIGGGKTVWMNGPVTRAFREAAAGKKVLLAIDELLRIPTRERSIFLNALTPHDGYYRLRTGRPINIDEKAGIASMEMLAAPMSNISVIATTNSGSNFPDVANDDPAARERWLILHVKPDDKLVLSLVESRLNEHGLPLSHAADFAAVVKAIKTVADDNNCEKAMSPRLVLDAVDLFADSKKKDKQAISDSVAELIPGLTGRTPDGDIIEDQSTSIKTAVKTALKM